jgi:hypothetical protein
VLVSKGVTVERVSVATGEMDRNEPIRNAMFSFGNGRRVNVHVNGGRVLVAQGGGDVSLEEWIIRYL